MNAPSKTAILEPLTQSDLTVADPAEDIRGRTVYDRDGEEIGTVDDLIIDREERKVRFIRLVSGGILGIGEERYLVPVDAITGIDRDVRGGVRIDQTHQRVAGAPKYEPDLAADPGYYRGLYGYYGFAPYWGADYVYPPYPYFPPR